MITHNIKRKAKGSFAPMICHVKTKLLNKHFSLIYYFLGVCFLLKGVEFIYLFFWETQIFPNAIKGLQNVYELFIKK